MHIELIELIRCPNDHPFSWLVAQTAQISRRDVLTGMLGCPVCGAKFLLNEGVLDLRLEESPEPAASDASASEEDAVRMAALLGLTEPGGMVLLAGDHAAVAPLLSRMYEGVHVLALNPTARVESGDGMSVVLTDGQVPLRHGAARGIALDAAHAARDLEGVAQLLADHGRLIAPAGRALPRGVRELARDDREWLAERPATPQVVPLRRG